MEGSALRRKAEVVLSILLIAKPAESRDEVAAAVRFFTSRDIRCAAALAGIRPRRVPDSVRAGVLRDLPPEGELTPTAAEREKLDAIRAAAALHDRDDIEVKLVDVFQAALALHARCVLLVSRHALDLLTREELQALAAHEIGHDYFWRDFEVARGRRDDGLRRDLELRCDGVAVLTLAALHRTPEALASGLAKLERYNARFGAALDRGGYPTLSERVRFERQLAAAAHSACAQEKPATPDGRR